ncbi:MAG: hypothetical protein RLZZ211_809 [Bacteroidota bacterium]|jgi:hypothetical protein
MSLLRPLNLPPAPLKLSSSAGRIYVNCLVRKKQIILTPEEWVRQHLIALLHFHQGFPLEKIAVEKQIQYDGFTRRWDIVVYNDQFEADILVECKAPQIKLSHEVFMQISSYQKMLQANCLILSNGDVHLVYEIDTEQQRLTQMNCFPQKSN